jgi:hypothetical protein
MAARAYVTLERLATMSPEEMKAEWARRYAAPAPNLSADLLRLGLGYRLQEQRLGGISRSIRTLLHRVAAQGEECGPAKTLPRKLTPGTRLVRDWHGTGHTVVVLEDGFEYGGKHWNSLTAIARAITGNHWNGPLFFGLTQRGKKA